MPSEKLISAPDTLEAENARLQEEVAGLLMENLALKQNAEAAEAHIRELEAALEPFILLADSIARDLSTANANRGEGASQWMREDDAELRRDFRKAVESARLIASGRTG